MLDTDLTEIFKTKRTAELTLTVCSDKIRLINDILGVHKRIACMQNQMSEALLTGEFDSSTADRIELDKARGLRRWLMEELNRHIDLHGC